jgi:hypothetical protein
MGMRPSRVQGTRSKTRETPRRLRVGRRLLAHSPNGRTRSAVGKREFRRSWRNIAFTSIHDGSFSNFDEILSFL